MAILRIWPNRSPGSFRIMRIWQYCWPDIQFWVMREYNVPESWTFLWKFNRADLPILKNVTQFKPIFVTESSTLVLEHYGKLIRIECHEKEKPVCSGQYAWAIAWGDLGLVWSDSVLTNPTFDIAIEFMAWHGMAWRLARNEKNWSKYWKNYVHSDFVRIYFLKNYSNND